MIDELHTILQSKKSDCIKYIFSINLLIRIKGRVKFYFKTQVTICFKSLLKIV